MSKGHELSSWSKVRNEHCFISWNCNSYKSHSGWNIHICTVYVVILIVYGIYIRTRHVNFKYIYIYLHIHFYHSRVLQTLRAPYPLAFASSRSPEYVESGYPCDISDCGFLDHFSSSFNRCQHGFQVMRLNGIFLRLGDGFADADGCRELHCDLLISTKATIGHWVPRWSSIDVWRLRMITMKLGTFWEEVGFHSQVEHDGH